jgi:hypothetical protein
MEEKEFSFEEYIKTLLLGIEFKDAAIAQKVNVNIDPIINDIMKDVDNILEETYEAEKEGKEDNENYGTIQWRICNILAKRLQMSPDDKNFTEVLEAKLDTKKVNLEKFGQGLAKVIQKEKDKGKEPATFLEVLVVLTKNFMDIKTKGIIERQKQDAVQGNTAKGGSPTNTKKHKKEKEKEKGGTSGKFYFKGEPSYRGLDNSRISKMVQGMFHDIQTMGFVAAYLDYERTDEFGELHQNSPGWKDMQKREKELAKMRGEQALKIQAEEAERAAQAGADKTEEKEEKENEKDGAEGTAKLTTPILKKNGKGLDK